MNYSDEQLKMALAKMLPEKIREVIYTDEAKPYSLFYWKNNNMRRIGEIVLDTELLHLCWMVEETFSPAKLHQSSEEWANYCIKLGEVTCDGSNIHASWQQRVQALAKVKNIEIL